MAVVDTPWDGAASRFPSTDAFCQSCLIDLNKPGAKKTQDSCKLPIHEPSGAINKNALSAALGRLGQTDAPVPAKKKAARALLAAYRQADMDVPPSLKSMAS